MKKLFALLLAAALLLTLCACGSSPAPAQTQPPETDGGALITGEAAQDADGLNEYGLPDLSMYSAEEIWDMYLHPENWDASVLTLTDGDFAFGDPEPYSDPEVDPDYVFDLGDWHDYDPGDWTPGPDEAGAFDWSEFGETGGEGGETPVLPTGAELPEECAFLLPDGLRDGDFTLREGDALILNLLDRSAADFDAMVQRAKDAGYTIDPHEMDLYGSKVYSASLIQGYTAKSVAIMLQSGAIMVTLQ